MRRGSSYKPSAGERCSMFCLLLQAKPRSVGSGGRKPPPPLLPPATPPIPRRLRSARWRLSIPALRPGRRAARPPPPPPRSRDSAAGLGARPAVPARLPCPPRPAPARISILNRRPPDPRPRPAQLPARPEPTEWRRLRSRRTVQKRPEDESGPRAVDNEAAGAVARHGSCAPRPHLPARQSPRLTVRPPGPAGPWLGAPGPDPRTRAARRTGRRAPGAPFPQPERGPRGEPGAWTLSGRARPPRRRARRPPRPCGPARGALDAAEPRRAAQRPRSRETCTCWTTAANPRLRPRTRCRAGRPPRRPSTASP